MLRICGAFSDEEDDKGSWDKGHGDDDEDGDDNIGTRSATNKNETISMCIVTKWMAV